MLETPRGVRKVNAKAVDPVWTPPLWHYVEMAQIHGKKLVVMPRNGRVALPGGERLEVRDSLVGRWTPARGWTAWPVGDEIIIGASLYMPPVGTKNRVHHGQLGPFKLDVGDGYYADLCASYERKRDMLADAVRDAGMQPTVPQGAYYMLADIRGAGFSNDKEAANALLQRTGVAAVPGSAFHQSNRGETMLRFCFAKDFDVLEDACNRIRRL